MVPVLYLGAVASTPQVRVFVEGNDLSSVVDLASVAIDRTVDADQLGGMTFTVIDQANAYGASVREGFEVRVYDGQADVDLFGGTVTAVHRILNPAVGLTLRVSCVDYGSMLDDAVIVSFKPGNDGATLGSAVQSLVGNFTALRAFGNPDIGIDRDNFRFVEDLASQATITTMPTLTNVSVREGIKQLYDVADRSSTTTSTSTSTTTSTKTLTASADATVALSGSNLGGGADAHLPVGLYSGFTYRSLAKFSLSWTGVSKIVSARLYLRTSDQNHLAFGSTPRMKIQRLTTSWSEGSVSSDGAGSWSGSNAVVYPGPSATSTDEVDTGTITRSENTWVSYDITGIVEAWAPSTVQAHDGTPGGGQTNNGLRLVSFDEASTSRTTEFYSRNGSTGDPYIKLTYQTTTTTGGTVTTGSDEPLGDILLYVDPQRNVFSYLAETAYDGTAPFVVTDDPAPQTPGVNELAPTGLDYETDKSDLVHAVYVVGGTPAATGWVRGSMGDYAVEKQAILDDSTLTTAAERDAAGQAFLNEHSGDSSIHVEVTTDDSLLASDGSTEYGDWRPGQLLSVSNAALFGDTSGRIARLQTHFLKRRTGYIRVYDIDVSPRRPPQRASKRLLMRVHER